MLRLFQNSFIFGEATYSHFFRVTTLTQQLLFRSMYFFRAAAFLRSSLFLEQSLFSKQLSFQSSYFSRAKHLPSGHFLRIESSLWQLLFRTATILAVVLFKIKISTEELLFYPQKSSKQILLHRINFFRKATFWKIANFSEKQNCALPTFSGKLPF